MTQTNYDPDKQREKTQRRRKLFKYVGVELPITALELLDQRAKANRISRSELIRRILFCVEGGIQNPGALEVQGGN